MRQDRAGDQHLYNKQEQLANGHAPAAVARYATAGGWSGRVLIRAQGGPSRNAVRTMYQRAAAHHQPNKTQDAGAQQSSKAGQYRTILI